MKNASAKYLALLLTIGVTACGQPPRDGVPKDGRGVWAIEGPLPVALDVKTSEPSVSHYVRGFDAGRVHRVHEGGHGIGRDRAASLTQVRTVG